MNDKFLNPYKHKETEARIYRMWFDSGYFNPDNLPERHVVPFSIILPPPNVTGSLHIGHAFEHSLLDIVVRFERMRGKKVLWLPGTDHAAIATQSKVEQILIKDGLDHSKLGRDEFLRRVNEFAEKSKITITSQIKMMGASLDWSREAFTLDKRREVAVIEAFKKLFDLGLIYKGKRVVNWDPKGQTVISDDEVMHEEREAELYTFKYWSDFPIPISTTRPETKLGDTAVAVHPKDTRYKDFVGKTYSGDFAGVRLNIKIIADAKVDMDFGTGAIGITPMHSQVDAEISARHGIEGYQVIDELRRILVEPYKGLKTGEARELILKWLAQNNLLTNTEKITQNIALAERTGGIIEPLPKKQWFVAVNKVYRNYQNQETTLKNEMVNALREEGGVSILPENFAKIYINWVENLRDWCISRQIWYGHRIPVWYRRHDSREGNQGLEIQKSNLDEDRDIQVGEKPLDIDNWEQDPDTLDTWFSSGLWTFSTLGWPEETRDLKTYHPNSLVISGYEILFFWIARMILMSKSLLGEIPFKKVYIHGMVRDKQGRKFSKSLGNGIDPIEIIDKYGADALRMALVIGASPGSDSKFDESKVSAYRKFSNKLWNISRFVLSHERTRQGSQVLKTDLKEEFDSLSRDILNDMHSYRFDIAAEKLYAYIWHRFADEIIEKSKGQDDYGDTLYYILENSLKLLHPFMPFITEEIWQELRPGSLLMIEPLPSN